jgi:hypothetical protein
MSTHLHIELTLTLDQAIRLQNLLHLAVQNLDTQGEDRHLLTTVEEAIDTAIGPTEPTEEFTDADAPRQTKTTTTPRFGQARSPRRSMTVTLSAWNSGASQHSAVSAILLTQPSLICTVE